MNKPLLQNKTVVVVVLTLLASLAGCSSKSAPQAVSQGSLTPVVKIDRDGVFAADPDGQKVAFVRGALQLYVPSSPEVVVLSRETPAALAWNRDGTKLAAVYPAGENRTRLKIFDPRGTLLLEVTLPVTYLRLKWPTQGDLLLVGYALKNYSFGSNLTQTLYIVTASGPVPLSLSDTTIKPATAKAYEGSLGEFLPVAFSSQGDELVYARLHDPPEFPPYLQLVYRNWQVPREVKLERVSLEPLRLSLQQRQERVDLFTPAGALTASVDLWGEPRAIDDEESHSAGLPSPSGQYRFVAGRLYDGPNLLAQWAPGSRFQFLTAGRFMLAVDEQLYLGSGLEDESWPVYREKAWVLRRWLHHGLITYEEYLAQLKELLP